MYRFEHKEYFYLLLSIVLMVVVFIIQQLLSKSRKEKLGKYNLVNEHFPLQFGLAKWLKFIFIIFAMFFLIIGIVNLQTFSGSREVKVKGSDIMICLDISNSMLAQDLTPNRLERAKMALQKMIDRLEGDKIGIIVFAGDAFVQLPLTVDYNAAKIFIQSINTNMVSIQGTNVGSALQKAIESFDNSNGIPNSKAIILITDGEDHDGDALKIAEDAANKNIPIHCIGIGSENGAPIPIIENGRVTGFKKDKEGNTVITKLNKTFIEDIAEKTKGIVVLATNTDFGLNTLLDEIKKLGKGNTDTLEFKDYDSQYQWFIALSLFFLTLDFLLSERKPKWLTSIKLFKNV